MNERNLQKHGKIRQIRKRKINRIIILTLFFIMIALTMLALISKGVEEHIIINPTGKQSRIDRVSSKAEKADDLQSLTGNTDWRLTLVNKWNYIPENYEVNLVKVPGGEKVDERIYEPLMKMLEAAKEENWGELPKVVSGYRTHKKQQKLYDKKITEYKQEGYSEDEAIKQAEQWVAVPGYSEHQLGSAIDINGATYDLYFWLQENSYKYGFIFRYPGSKTNITDTAEEVWHYRYVGVEAATKMYEQGLCLEEYLDKTGEFEK